MVKIGVAKAKALLVAINMNPKAVEKYGPKELAEKLSSLHKVPNIDQDRDKLQDNDLKNLMSAVLTSGRDNKPIEVTDPTPGKTAAEEAIRESKTKVDKPKAAADDNPPRPAKKAGGKTPPPPAKKESKVKTAEAKAPSKNGKTAPPAKKPAAKAPDKKERPAAPRKEPAEKDEWGYRVGTRAARVNAAITDRPRTHSEILAAAKYDKPVHGQLRGLVKKGHVEYDATAKTYVRAGAKPAKKVKPKK